MLGPNTIQPMCALQSLVGWLVFAAFVLLLPVSVLAQRITIQSARYPDNPTSTRECQEVHQANLRLEGETLRAGQASCDSRFPNYRNSSRDLSGHMRCGDEVTRIWVELGHTHAQRYSVCMAAARQREEWQREQQAMEERNQQRAADQQREQQAMRQRWAEDERRARERQRTIVTPIPSRQTVPERSQRTPQEQARVLGQAWDMFNRMRERSDTDEEARREREESRAEREREREERRAERERQSFESQTDRVHEYAERALNGAQRATGQGRGIGAIEDRALEGIREIHTDTARQWDRTVSSLDELEVRPSAASSTTSFNMRGSPDPALRNNAAVSSLDELEASPLPQSTSTTPPTVIADLDSLEDARSIQNTNRFPSIETVSTLDALEESRDDSCVPLTNSGPRVRHGQRARNAAGVLWECRRGIWVVIP